MAINRQFGLTINDVIEYLRQKQPQITSAFDRIQSVVNDLWSQLSGVSDIIDSTDLGSLPNDANVWLNGIGTFSNAQTPWNSDIAAAGFTLSGAKALSAKNIATIRGNITLANGLNSNINIGDFSFTVITGPSAGFDVGGFTGGTDGRHLFLFNSTSQAMTIKSVSGSSSVGNQIITPTGADVVIAGATNNNFAWFIYDLADGYWLTLLHS